ncbi:MAG: hypothetical protein JXB38_15370 [Anaerolineales bacterium]|nr:hypothetical protein [Anaerolineales bacterium]
MNRNTVRKIAKNIYRQFPEVEGSEPRVTPKAQAKSLTGDATYLLTFTGSGKNPAGKTISRTVRVTANANGKILKVSTSR